MRGKQQKGTSAGGFQYRACGIDQRVDEIRTRRFRHLHRQIEQALVLPVERARLHQHTRLVQAQLGGQVIDRIVDRKCCRGQNPGGLALFAVVTQRRRYIHRCGVEGDAALTELIPTDRRCGHIGVRFTVQTAAPHAPSRQQGFGTGRALIQRRRSAGLQLQGSMKFLRGFPYILQRRENFRLCGQDRGRSFSGNGFAFGAQLFDAQLQRFDRRRQQHRTAGDFSGFQQNILAQIKPLPGADRLAEELQRKFRNLMCFIENEHRSAGQDFAEAFLLDGQIGQQQMMVDHHDIGALRFLPRFDQMALAPVRALAAQTVVGGGADLRPDRTVFGNARELRQITTFGLAGPLHDALEMLCRLAAGEGFGFGLIHPEQAQIVGTPLQQGGMHRRRQRLFDARQIAVIKLVLQGFGAGGNDHAFAR